MSHPNPVASSRPSNSLSIPLLGNLELGRRKKSTFHVVPQGRWTKEERSAKETRKKTWVRWLEAVALPQPGPQRDRWELVWNVFLDFLAILCGTGSASMIGLAFLQQNLFGFSWISTLRFTALLGSFVTLIGYSEGLYRNSVTVQEGCRITRKCLLLGMILVSVCQVEGLTFSLAAGFLAAIFLLGRRVWWTSRQIGTYGPNVKNVMIIGSGLTARKLAEHLRGCPGEKRAVVGFLDDQAPIGEEVQGRIKDLPLLVKTQFVDEVIVAGVSEIDAMRAIQLAQRCSLDVQVVPNISGLTSLKTTLHQFGEIPALALREERGFQIEGAIKRALDLVFAVTALALAAPILGLIAIAIRLDSAGPALYTAERVGFKGRQFRCYKFRTMVVDADLRKQDLRVRNERCGATFKIDNDPRITRVGRWLRLYSMDELPQLWNIIKGEMSIVGPRPHPLDDFARYEVDDLKRLEAIPGLTGLWQVCARNNPSFKLNVQLDRDYIEHWNLKTDLKIMLKTVSTVLQGTGT